MYVNELHMNLFHTVEEKMRVTAKHPHYSMKGTLDVCEYCATKKIKQKSLRKVAEDQDLNLGRMIYLDISSQNNPSYGGSNNWISPQDAGTK